VLRVSTTTGRAEGDLVRRPKVQAIISPVLLKRLEAQATERGLTVSALCSQVLEMYFAHEWVMKEKK
jgi:hypothetical protein